MSVTASCGGGGSSTGIVSTGGSASVKLNFALPGQVASLDGAPTVQAKAIAMTRSDLLRLLIPEALAAATPGGIASVRIAIANNTSGLNIKTDVFNATAGQQVNRTYNIPIGGVYALGVQAFSGVLGTGTKVYQATGVINLVAAVAGNAVTVPITMIPLINVPPVPTAPAISTIAGASATSQIAANDPNAGDTFTAAITTPPANGTAAVNASGLVAYNPTAGFTGTDSITVTVTDQGGLTGTVTIPVTVSAPAVPVNNPPQFTGLPAIVQTAAAPATVLTLSGLATSDADGDTVTLTYKWRSSGAVIAGATAASYTVQAADIGKIITCVITADDGSGAANATVSATTNGLTPSATVWIARTSGTTNAIRGGVSGSNLGVAVGDLGTIQVTTDGVIWQTVTPITSNALNDAARNALRFVAVGAVGTILTSHDGSAWTSRGSGTSNNLFGVATNGRLVVAVGASDTILRSTDGGVTWAVQTSGTTGVNLRNVVWAASPAQFIAVGDGGTMLISGDGSSWSPVTTGTTQPLYDVLSTSTTSFVAVGAAGTILTSNNGSTWVTRVSGTSNTLSGVAWSGTHYAVAGASGTILVSTDGINWSAQSSGTTSNLSDLVWYGQAFVSVGAGGTILTTTDEVDSDSDRLSDAMEAWLGTSSSQLDSDADGLDDGYEFFNSHTTLLDPDTDADGVGDGIEVFRGQNPFAANTVGYVDAVNGNDANNGSSWVLAKKTLAAALTAAPNGTVASATFILIAQGTYAAATISGRSYLQLVGSLTSTTFYPSRSLRASTIDALNGASGVLISNSTGVHLNGLRITRGSASIGAGVRIVSSSTDAGIHLCDVFGNTATGAGGGVYVDIGNSAVIDENTRIYNNTAQEGGGIYALGSLDIIESVVSNNLASSGSSNTGGGGLLISPNASADSVNIKSSVISGNKSNFYGGGIYVRTPVPNQGVVIFNNRVIGNLAAVAGGGIKLHDPNGAPVFNNTIAYNQANSSGGGGGITYFESGVGAAPSIHDNVLWFNEDITVEQAINAGESYNDSAVIGTAIAAAISTYNDIGQGAVGTGDISVNPNFQNGFYLDQTLISPTPGGPVNAGSTTAFTYFSSGETTDSSGVEDSGQVDMGAHYFDPTVSPVGLTVLAVSPLQSNTTSQEVVISDVDSALPGRKVFVRTTAGTTGGVTLSSLTGHDPLNLGVGNSVLARDNGDGTYSFFVNTPNVISGTVNLQVVLDGVSVTGSQTW